MSSGHAPLSILVTGTCKSPLWHGDELCGCFALLNSWAAPEEAASEGMVSSHDTPREVSSEVWRPSPKSFPGSPQSKDLGAPPKHTLSPRAPCCLRNYCQVSPHIKGGLSKSNYFSLKMCFLTLKAEMAEIPQDEMRNHSWKEHQRVTPRDSTIKQTDTHNILDECPEHHVERKKKKKSPSRKISCYMFWHDKILEMEKTWEWVPAVKEWVGCKKVVQL